MQISIVLNHRHTTCVLLQRFFCVQWHIFIPFYSISLCFLNPCKCLEHAISSTTQHRKHLPLFLTWHTLALFVASDIWWETSWNCSPFPSLLTIFTAQYSHSKDGKSSFNHLLVQNCFHTFFWSLLSASYFLQFYLFINKYDGGETEPYKLQVSVALPGFIFDSPHKHPQHSGDTLEHRGMFLWNYLL